MIKRINPFKICQLARRSKIEPFSLIQYWIITILLANISLYFVVSIKWHVISIDTKIFTSLVSKRNKTGILYFYVILIDSVFNICLATTIWALSHNCLVLENNSLSKYIFHITKLLNIKAFCFTSHLYRKVKSVYDRWIAIKYYSYRYYLRNSSISSIRWRLNCYYITRSSCEARCWCECVGFCSTRRRIVRIIVVLIAAWRRIDGVNGGIIVNKR